MTQSRSSKDRHHPSRRKNQLFTLLALCTVAGIVAGNRVSGASMTQGVPGSEPKVDQAKIRANPDKFSWEVFVAISKPEPGPGNNNVVWENWVDSALVYGDPNHEPTWPANGNAPGKFDPKINSGVGEPITRIKGESLSQREVAAAAAQFRTDGTREEVRMNQATFNFIVHGKLWYVEGQQEAFTKGDDLSFPMDAKEIKAVWRVITPEEQPRYHWQTTHGKLYGLVALHITTRDLPDWVWATFEHVDNVRKCKDLQCKDGFGVLNQKPSPALLTMFKAAGLGSEWENYRLVGSQIDYVDKSGKPTLVGNSEIEGSPFSGRNFVKSSSCITCHARSTINGQGNFLPVYKSTKPLEGYVGRPDPSWFKDGAGKKLFIKRDFVWSLFEARCKCVHIPGDTLSFAKDIAPMFRQIDIQCMAERDVFVAEYSYMSDPVHAERVYDKLTGANGASVMPPDGKWPQERLDKFKLWMDAGRKP